MLTYIEVMLCGSRCGWPGHQLRLLVPVAPRRPRGLRQVDAVMTSDIDHSTAQAPEKQLTTKELLWSKTDPKSIRRGERGQNRGWGFKTGWSLLLPLLKPSSRSEAADWKPSCDQRGSDILCGRTDKQANRENSGKQPNGSKTWSREFSQVHSSRGPPKKDRI